MIKLNEYYNGKVKSLGEELNGEPFTVGIIEPGEYEFETSKEEHMKIVHGKLEALLPDKKDYNTYTPGKEFIVPPNKKFKVRVEHPVAYLCIYK